RDFLLVLFHEGLGKPEDNREKEIREEIGRVPYLNGGLFDVHEIEIAYREINIRDEAFERIFEFFDQYNWHLDTRITASGRDINPDVIGYIFEKYINDRAAMGAYYTKEDITGYISRNTIIPFLFDDAKKRCATAFKPDGGIWRLLRENPDRYIYPAVKHGLTVDFRTGAKLDKPFKLPDNIAAGVRDVGQRGDWGKVASEDMGLPTETWREVVARRERHDELVGKLAKGEVTDINELVTLNLDIERFALDAIEQAESSDLVKAFWEAVTLVSVLDPTCGSGAFLFAALEVLKPMYDACLSGMAGFVEDIDRSGDDPRKKKLEWARSALEQAAKHPSEDYYIYKSIVIGNLYGVDLMREAVEICKLRLFLKLVAQVQTVEQIEPLPDIDFNIRPGNTLVGFTTVEQIRKVVEGEKNVSSRKLDFGGDYARLEEQIQETSRKFQMFRAMQTKHDMDAAQFHSAKGKLRVSLDALREELDTFLSSDYGVLKGKPKELAKWRESHQPMHWIAEFFAQVSKGGFDVIVGNPPYIEMSKIAYGLPHLTLAGTGNLFSVCVERSLALLSDGGRFGMIVPISAVSTPRMFPLLQLLSQVGSTHFANFAVRPGKLFVG
ncbi:MAG: Eco57I restriction-modification methylase domain-containing protein, partial [Planctomycetes bacterium]|nr:Eco57I restriction-modification methylase domain-containing protein [Planctomycetota bacterium]